MAVIVKPSNFDGKMKGLRAFNIILGLIHFSLGMFVLFNSQNLNPFVNEIPIYKTGTSIASDGNSYSLVANEKAGTAYLSILICVFFFITAAFHFLYALGATSWYKKMIENGNNPLRWLEYSITATIMVVIIAIAATVQIQQQLLLIIAMTVVIMLMGDVIEKSVASGNFATARMVTLLAWVLELMIFYVIGSAFVETIRAVNDKLKADEADVLIPSWVYTLIIAQLVFYSLFGIVSLTEVVRASTGKKINFFNYEVGYHSLSIISKMTLGLVFYFGAASDNLGRSCDKESDCEGSRGQLKCRSPSGAVPPFSEDTGFCPAGDCTCQFIRER